MRVQRVSSVMMTLAVWVTAHGQTPAPAAKQPTPVVVELFTSEGCSSCPPADDLLAMLVKSQPVPGVQIIGLGEHVDYWDRLGWRDQFSSAKFTARQNDYAARVFHTDDIYTPQMIVNGAEQVVGNKVGKVKEAIARAAEHQPSISLSLTIPNEPAAADRRTSAQVQVQLHASVIPGAALEEPAELLLAITEEGLGSRVLRGENSGRDLRHGSVVRTLIPVGTITARDGSWSTTKSVALDKDWNPRQVRIVALAQAKKSRRILGAAIAPLTPGSQATASQ